MNKLTSFKVLLAIFLTACAPIIPGSGEPTPVEITAVVSTVVASTAGPLGTEDPLPTAELPTAIPTLPSATLTPTELKYKVLDQFPDFFFCDPDSFPVASGDGVTVTEELFRELQANQEEFQAILSHNGLTGLTSFTEDQKLLIYNEHKKLNALPFQLVADRYEFQIQTGTEGQQGSVITGTIDGNGSIDIQDQSPAIPTCPICLAIGTRIDTPRGAVVVENLHVGDSVWTVNEAGERVVGKILKLGSVKVPSIHQVIHVLLSDGRDLWASPGHPTADGRSLGQLKIGDFLDGARIIRIERAPYNRVATYDLLPSGDTGYYWADGILMGSTLKLP